MSDERFVEITRKDGTRVTGRIREGDGPTLVLIPGTWGNLYTRGPMMERLDPSLRIVNVALPGQDDNWPPPEHPSIPEFSEDVLRLMDAIGIAQFVVGGNSLGGMIAVDMLRFAPDRVIGAIPIEGWTRSSVATDAFGGNVRGCVTEEQQKFVEKIRHKLLDRWDPELRRRYSTIWHQWDGWDILNASEVPVLEIWGDRGQPRPSRTVMAIPDRPNIELRWIVGCSHSLLVEAPEALATLINGFMRRFA